MVTEVPGTDEAESTGTFTTPDEAHPDKRKSKQVAIIER
jgi:hypothetical protein